MKVFRRTPMPEPGARERALARLAARPPTHVRPVIADLSPGQPPRAVGRRAGEPLHDLTDPRRDQPRDDYLEERDDEVRGGWIPEQVRPERLRDARWTLSPRHVLVLLAVLAVGLSWAAWSFFQARPETLPDAQPTTATSGSPVAQPTPGSPSAAQPQPSAAQSPGAQSPGAQQVLVVYVAGKVRRPGLVRAPTGARVADVLTLAGGPLPGVDLTTLNLARQVTDGEQITVGQPTQPEPTNPPGTASPSASSSDPVNLNTATLAELDALPGVGPVLAQRILDYRTQNGPFTTIDQLQEVPGVGPKKFDSLKPHVRL